jgi:hypothetical protein
VDALDKSFPKSRFRAKFALANLIFVVEKIETQKFGRLLTLGMAQ